MEQHIFSVTEVNELVKRLLDDEPMLSGICVRGEISNYKMYPSGHHYFSLKDATGAIRCVMFRGQAMRLRFRPENGMKVLVTGRVSVFPRDGAYQLYCNTMTPEGAGDLALAFEQLKERLYKEGLFDEGRKKPLPEFPERIAVVTSSAGAAVHDMIRILRRRYPLAKVILWAFNDERVARAIYACETPVISAVGHEPDVTISDFVADRRASTPSNAAEIAVPDRAELLRHLSSLSERMNTSEATRLQTLRERLDALKQKRVLTDQLAYVQDRRMELAHLQQRLGDLTRATITEKQKAFTALAASLDAMSPLKVLGRGYALTLFEEGTKLANACTTELDKAEQQVVKLMKGPDGAPVELPFESTED